jgi:hypothetical protein
MAGDAGRGRRKSVPEARGEGRKARPKVTVDVHERRHLIEACAFFRADRFRPAEPGSYREQDLKDVAAEIDAVLARGDRKARKR